MPMMMKQKTYPTTAKKHDKKSTISGEKLRKATKPRGKLSFSTGRHMSQKDRPRKKRWDLEE